MTGPDITDPAALKTALDALPLDHWIDVTTNGETFRLVRVPGGWHVPGDLVIASGDVADGRPVSVEVLGDLFGEDPVPVEDHAGGRDDMEGWPT